MTPQALLTPSAPIVDPATGVLTQAGFRFFLSLWTRTGRAQGVDAATVQATANTAQTDAGTAQTSATAAQTTATAAQTAASAASAAVTAETARATGAEALLAPKAAPVFTVSATAPTFKLSGGPTWTAGIGAPAGTQPNGSLYSREDGTAGARLYVSTGSAWAAVAGV